MSQDAFSTQVSSPGHLENATTHRRVSSVTQDCRASAAWRYYSGSSRKNVQHRRASPDDRSKLVILSAAACRAVRHREPRDVDQQQQPGVDSLVKLSVKRSLSAWAEHTGLSRGTLLAWRKIRSYPSRQSRRRSDHGEGLRGQIADDGAGLDETGMRPLTIS